MVVVDKNGLSVEKVSDRTPWHKKNVAHPSRKEEESHVGECGGQFRKGVHLLGSNLGGGLCNVYLKDKR